MSTAGFLIIYFSNFKKNSFNLGKRDKINNLKTNIIINNTVKIRRDDNLNFLNNKNDFKRGNKRRKRFIIKK